MTREPEEPFLFDLPLAGPPPSAAALRGESPPRRGVRRAARPESLPLFGESDVEAADSSSESLESSFAEIPVAPARGPVPVPRPREHEEALPGTGPATAPLPRRLRAACGDLAVLVAVGAVGAVGATMLGAHLRVDTLPALFVFLLSFSFLYSVVSLAFWGQTPGMAWCGLIARSEETEPLSFGQTALRWIGHWMTWVLLGLPGLLALSGRSLVDRLSGSSTYELPLSGSAGA